MPPSRGVCDEPPEPGQLAADTVQAGAHPAGEGPGLEPNGLRFGAGRQAPPGQRHGRSGSAEVFPGSWPGSGSLYLAMGVFDQPVKRLQSYDPFPPVWRMRCLCSFRAGKAGEIAACGCRFWWRVGKRGRWFAISRRRALRVLARELRSELDYFDVTGNWPTG